MLILKNIIYRPTYYMNIKQCSYGKWKSMMMLQPILEVNWNREEKNEKKKKSDKYVIIK